ncbi:MAG: molybdopterin-dependent oxidoreductase [Nitriliruptorales bacterium]|nr:molybdopterin-dependent oxidoreductase [Nitriliruptorales bacterium]
MSSSLRREDARLVTGTARFTGDLGDGALCAAFVRSTVAHGRLTTLALDSVRAQPGVVAAFGAADLDLADIPGTTGTGPDAPAMARPPLVRDRVRYAGEALAVVIAEDGYLAADAMEHADLVIEPDPVVADASAALTDEVVLFPAAGTNVVSRTITPDGPSPDLDAWPVKASVEVRNQRLAPAPIEPLGILAEPSGEGLTIWCGHQAPHRLRSQLCRLLGLDPAGVHVVVPDVGGAFGMKGMLYPEYLVVAAAARRLGRPVRWVQDRYEQFVCGTHGRGQRHRMTLAGDRDGTIRAARAEIVADVGAYPHNGSGTPLFTSYMTPGPYAISHLQVTTTMVVTNRAPTGSYRGAGRPEAAYAMERAVEAFAAAAGVDAVDVRRRSFVPPDRMPHRTPTGAHYDSGDYPAALDLALQLIDAQDVRAEQRRRRAEGAHPIGLGIGAFVERAGGAPDSTEFARVELQDDGRLVARVGTSATGQGHETTWSDLVADVFSVKPGLVTVLSGDTREVAHGTGSFASRSAQIGGSAVQRTAQRVHEAARAVAADLLEIAPRDLRAGGGRFAAVGDPEAAVGLKAVAAHAHATGVDLAAEESYSPHAQTFPYGVHAAVVEVDLETGKVNLRRMAAVDDCGNVLHPQIVEGQVHGSLAQGVAQALYEEVTYDEDGQPLTSSFADYLVPAAPDLPAFTTARLTSPAPSNPLGAKGAGEAGCIGAPPAIVNAALDALRPYGVTDLQMPLTPEHVWRALQAARESAALIGEAGREKRG